MKCSIYAFICLATLCSFDAAHATSKEEVSDKTGAAVAAAVDYTAEQKKIFQNEMEQKIKNLQSEIAEMKKSVAQKTGTAKKQMQEHIDYLEEKQTALNKDFSQLKKSSGNAWGRMKVGVSGAWDSLSDSYKKAKSEFKE